MNYNFIPTNLTSSAFHERLKLFRANAPKYTEFDATKTPPGKTDLDGWQEVIGYIDGELKYVIIQFDSTLKEFQPINIKQGVADSMDSLLVHAKSASPPEMKVRVLTFEASTPTAALTASLLVITRTGRAPFTSGT